MTPLPRPSSGPHTAGVLSLSAPVSRPSAQGALGAARRVSDDEVARLQAELYRTRERLAECERTARRERIDALGRVTAAVAHEIANPLNFVTGFAELVAEGLADVRDQLLATFPAGSVGDLSEDLDLLAGNIARVLDHGRRAAAVVRRMADHDANAHGDREPTDLHALLREVVTGACPLRADRPADIVLDLDPLVPLVDVDREAVGRALAGLVENARLAVADPSDGGSPKDGSSRVVVRTRRGVQGVEVRIEDDGPGLPEAVRARAFEPFVTTRPTGQGTGLGLSAAWRVAESHGGTVAVASVLGGGTAVTVTLPALTNYSASRVGLLHARSSSC